MNNQQDELQELNEAELELCNGGAHLAIMEIAAPGSGSAKLNSTAGAFAK